MLLKLFLAEVLPSLQYIELINPRMHALIYKILLLNENYKMSPQSDISNHYMQKLFTNKERKAFVTISSNQKPCYN